MDLNLGQPPLQLHLLTKSNGLYECPRCQESFAKVGLINRHYKKHSRPYCCQTCSAGFALRTDLIRHRNARHQGSYEPFNCNWPGCNKSPFSRSDLLKKHMLKEHVQKAAKSSPSTLQAVERVYQDSLARQRTAVQSTSMLVSLQANDSIVARSKPETLQHQAQLHRAARVGDEALVTYLLRTGIDINLLTQNGETALHLAVKNEHENIALALIAGGADCSIPVYADKNEKRKTVLELALEKGQATLLEVLLEREEEPSQKVLLRSLSAAIRSQHEIAVAWILKRFPDIAINSSIDSDRKTVLHVAAKIGNVSITTALLKGGADVKSRDRRGQTVIHYQLANSFGSEEALRLLISQGADVTVKGHYGRTPLHVAATWSNSIAAHQLLKGGEVVQLLKKNGLNWEERDNFGKTALMIAVGRFDTNFDLIKFMIDRGADVNARDNEGRTVLFEVPDSKTEVAKLLIDRGADVNARGKTGQTALFGAGLELTKCLISHGADLNVRDDRGQTALFAAVTRKTIPWWETSRSRVDCAKCLIDCGACVDIQDVDGQTLLMAAEGEEMKDLIRGYLDRSAQAGTRNEVWR